MSGRERVRGMGQGRVGQGGSVRVGPGGSKNVLKAGNEKYLKIFFMVEIGEAQLMTELSNARILQIEIVMKQ